MSDLANTFPVPVTCPKCGHKIEQTLGRLNEDLEFDCPGCGVHFVASRDQIDEAREPLQRLDDAVNRFVRKFNKRA